MNSELKLTWRERWKRFKIRLSCSRPFLALHVLRGRPLMYNISGTIYLRETLYLNSKHTRIVGMSFNFNDLSLGSKES